MLDSIKFYNGTSSVFKDRFQYTKPDTDFKEENGVAYFAVDAKPESFFRVPFEMETPEGTWRISVHKEITDRYGPRGIVRVDPNAAEAIEANPDDPKVAYVAANDETAKVKGKELWRSYLRQIVDDFEAENARRVTERGITPLRPNNFVAHAYKELGLEVPGDERFIKAGLQKDDVSELKATVARQAEQIDKLLALHKPAETAEPAPQATLQAESEEQNQTAEEPIQQEEPVHAGGRTGRNKGK